MLSIISATSCATLTHTPAPNLIPTNTVTPTFTKTPVPTATFTLTPEPSPAATISPLPTVTAVSIDSKDPFWVEIQNKGYKLYESGSFSDPNGSVYSAYVFVEPNLSDPATIDPTQKEIWVIAFYVWDGQKNSLIQTFYAPQYTNSYPDSGYPVGYYLMNWDDPADGSNWPSHYYLEYLVEPEDYPRQELILNGFSSDINHNGLPEFSFVSAFCPVSCNQAEIKYDFFEIQSTHSVVNLAANLPDHLSPYPYATNPMTFEVCPSQGYEGYRSITICKLYAWDKAGFTDVSKLYAEKYVESAEQDLQNLQAEYGQPFDYPYDLDALDILYEYEVAGMRETALQTFLDVTDITHWPSTTPVFACWLQVSRATVQEDFKNNRPFSMVPSPTHLEGGVKRFLEPFAHSEYDFSACQSLQP